MIWKIKNWEVIFYEDKVKIKRYDFPNYFLGEMKENKAVFNPTYPKIPEYLIRFIEKIYPVRLWKITIEGNEVVITAPGSRKTYSGSYAPGKEYLYLDFPEEIPRTVKEYLKTQLYFQNKLK